MKKVKSGNGERQYEAKLMVRILEVRFTDLEEQKSLCKQLLAVAEPEQYNYGCAFACVYLLDCSLALGQYSNCDFYLSRAGFLCREYGFDDLLLTLCNCAGLYYLKLNNEQTAIQYYLEGLKLARRMNDADMESKILNNMGLGFAEREDWTAAKTYFQGAYDTIEPHLAQANNKNAVSYLSNLAEASKHLGDAESSRMALSKCGKLCGDSLYHQLRLGCGWSSYYATIKDIERCTQEADGLLEKGLAEFDNKYFACDMIGGLCQDMMEIGDKERARKFLDIMVHLGQQVPLSVQYRIQCLEIEFGEKYGEEERLCMAYHNYYKVAQELTLVEGFSRAQSMISKIQLNQALQERETLKKERKELEDASQMDGLTGLYNRRYFNKMISKIRGNKEVYTVGFVMLDVDYFKQYNDFYGHFHGDNTLRVVARVLLENAGKGIYASRYGGDEFVCLCINVKDEVVEAYVRNIINGLKKQKIKHEKSASSSLLTMSVGYCNEKYLPEQEPEELFELADQALYKAKRNGRDGAARHRRPDASRQKG